MTTKTPGATGRAAINSTNDSWEARLAARLEAVSLTQSGAVEEILAQAKFELLGEFLEGLSVEKSDYYHNTANDYGTVRVMFFTGQGDPSVQFQGKPWLVETSKGVVQSGDVALPSCLAPVLWERSAAARKRQSELRAQLRAQPVA